MENKFVAITILAGTAITASKGRIRKKVLTSSTCSVVNGPPYLLLPKSIRDGRSSSQYVKALLCRGCLVKMANFMTLYINLSGFLLAGSFINILLKRDRSNVAKVRLREV